MIHLLYIHPYTYLPLTPSPLLTLLSLLHRPLSPFTSASQRLVHLPVFSVSKPVPLNLHHWQQLILSSPHIQYSELPLKSYPFTVRAVFQASAEITVPVHYWVINHLEETVGEAGTGVHGAGRAAAVWALQARLLTWTQTHGVTLAESIPPPSK